MVAGIFWDSGGWAGSREDGDPASSSRAGSCVPAGPLVYTERPGEAESQHRPSVIGLGHLKGIV